MCNRCGLVFKSNALTTEEKIKEFHEMLKRKLEDSKEN
jgi:hypothetical protein